MYMKQFNALFLNHPKFSFFEEDTNTFFCIIFPPYLSFSVLQTAERSRRDTLKMATQVIERTLEDTPTWAVAAVCFVLLAVSIATELIIHAVGHWFNKKNKRALYVALEKVKGELMLLGFISLLLTVFQDPISGICISEKAAATWHPCSVPNPTQPESDTESDSETNSRKLLEFLDPIPRRVLATKGYDKCADQGKVAFVSAYGIHQLHIFIFVLAIFHVLQCIITFALGREKMRNWKTWEDETKTIEYQFYNDAHQFETRDKNMRPPSPISLWIDCFFRQFLGSITKVEYMALRQGYIMAHFAPGSQSTFDFKEHINRSLEEDFKVVVGISPEIWFFAVLFLLTNTNGWRPYLWLPFIPLIIILVVGAKLQMIIKKMALRIQKGGDEVKPADDLFWFDNPRLILFLVHLVLFQNAFQLAFFAWSTYEFTIKSCFHKETANIVIRLTTGVVTQDLCSYVTLPLYAVTKMGSTRPASPTSASSSNDDNEHWDIEASPSPSHHQTRPSEAHDEVTLEPSTSSHSDSA